MTQDITKNKLKTQKIYVLFIIQYNTYITYVYIIDIHIYYLSHHNSVPLIVSDRKPSVRNSTKYCTTSVFSIIKHESIYLIAVLKNWELFSLSLSVLFSLMIFIPLLLSYQICYVIILESHLLYFIYYFAARIKWWCPYCLCRRQSDLNLMTYSGW